jgi:hypothetical protein
MNLNDWADIAQLVTAVAVVFAVLQLVGSRTQRHREFENLYVQRYWQLLDRMSARMYMGGEMADPTEAEKRLVVEYLRLCEDEIDLRGQGFVTNKTWAIWAEGIKAQLKSSIFEDALATHANSLPALRKFAQSGRDPLRRSPMGKWWAGLH